MKKEIKSLLYFTIGDVLGVPYEFKRRKQLENCKIDMIGYGTHNQPKGTWSDDTSLMLALIDTINNNYSKDKLIQNFQSFLFQAKYTPYQEVFDVGYTIKNAIISNQSQSRECDNGNGSLMRILPLGLVNEINVNLITEVSSITHGHPRSILACIFYCKFINELVNGNNKDIALNNTINFIINFANSNSFKNELIYFNRILDKSILSLDISEIKSTGYVIDTLESCIYIFMNNNNIKDCLINAVLLGGDTDTISALTGGLAGSYYNDNIDDWINCLARKDYLFDMFNKFCDKYNIKG